MGKQTSAKASVTFIGHSVEQVTGSAYLVEYKKSKILLDFGMSQGRNKLNQYQINARNFKFKAKEIDAVVLSHFNLDHYGLIPRLYRLGFTGKVYTSVGGKDFLKIAFEDSLKITESDREYLTAITGKVFLPLFEEEDVLLMLENIVEVPYGISTKIDDYFSFRTTSAYHITQSCQVELFVKDKSYSKKIYYSGDLGNINIDKPFLEPFEVIKNSDLAIVETTYAMNERCATQVTREADRKSLSKTVHETCMQKKGTLIVGTFAMQRLQEILFELYALYGDKEGFNLPILIDSPLATKITRMFDRLIPAKDKETWQKIMSWKVIKYVNSWNDSRAAIRQDTPAIVLACSGFLDNGRVRDWVKAKLPNKKNTIVFVGYSDDDSLASIIKAGKETTIVIDKEKVERKASVLILNSFSSHMQHTALLKLYSELNTHQIMLVHGEQDRKHEFANVLKEELSKKCNTARVGVPIKDEVVFVA